MDTPLLPASPLQPHLAYLGLGSNLGDRSGHLSRTRQALVAAGLRLLEESRIYQTEPVGMTGQAFLNQVVQVETMGGPFALWQYLLAVEAELGRTGKGANQPRTIDIDLLLFDRTVLEGPSLTLPHPRLHERAFVLVPLAELAPDLRHPTLGRSIRELLAALGPVPGVAPWHG